MLPVLLPCGELRLHHRHRHTGVSLPSTRRSTLGVGYVLGHVTEEQDIGVIVDAKLEFDKHIIIHKNKQSK